MIDFFKAIANIYSSKVEDTIESGQSDTSKTEPQSAIQPISSNSSYESQIIESVNKHRASLNLCVLQPIIQLSEIAVKHSQWMAQRNTASHAGVEKRYDQAISLGFKTFNENLAGGECYTWQLPEQMQRCAPGWILSLGHKRTMETPEFTYTGMGIVIVPHRNEPDRITYFVTPTFGGI